ncbi:NAD(P)-binding protein [Anaeromyces robustus]|uniref:NAD(P)-binding protein n=1 Tax=Anaeromyces robustus TaxID=1754192 RepID=A0A1Y1XJW4_9FUNG|nr:NAD(P)-binding protein [Anaeromyces robustus]|eukprot:ORX86049.1 NAD(P)-binding protein [Anaeromyces robustus]
MTWNIIVTGATGHYGSLAIDFIKKFNPEGVEPRIGDFSDKNSLIEAFKGMNRLLFVSVPYKNIQKNVVEAAKECGISYIVYTSIFGAEYSKFGLEINHKQTEQWIKESGIPYTILRNNWYIDLEEGLLHATKNTGSFLYTTKENKLSFALRREYAEVGARVILKEDNFYYNKIINLARTPFTYPELGKMVEEALGKKIEIKEVSMDEFQKYLEEANVTQQGKSVSLSMQTYVKNGNNGEELGDPKEFEEVLSRKLESLVSIIREYLSD